MGTDTARLGQLQMGYIALSQHTFPVRPAFDSWRRKHGQRGRLKERLLPTVLLQSDRLAVGTARRCYERVRLQGNSERFLGR